ncbi:dipeptide ABC transporter ATP-binding protein [Acinetobacter bouvetii]|uniref:Glutathione import ATP-binding protein GsiA n=1 Tax=Acinetobacter bouvetii TaxID=202951 RepID=A0A811G9F2_9GAMM|nr:ABC transporter ATP-binding protein [Acinetobacter bouvetii]CAB1214261.1 Glutathione import ATP-binding protein GsiA [Acinetobacter bouvetii]
MHNKTLVIDGLNIQFAHQTVVNDLSLTLSPGKCVALVGESGSGKSVTARSIVGLAGQGAQIQARQFSYAGQNLLDNTEKDWRLIRGQEIGFVLQDALVSLDPLRPVGKEILESLTAHGWGTFATRKEKVISLLEQVGIPYPELRANQRADQLSGGLRQRALIASALALNPSLVIADEPTTALDATVQSRILELLKQIKNNGNSLLLISHDLAVVSQLADEVLVLHHGKVLEQGPIEQILHQPQHPYTRSLLDALPASRPRGQRLSSHAQTQPRVRKEQNIQIIPLLEAKQIAKRYRGPDQQWRQIVEDINIQLYEGRTLGIVGESGSGKSTVARILLGLIEPEEGAVSFAGKAWNGAANHRIPERERRLRRRDISVIYQDPLSSFDPRWNVEQILEDALQVGGVKSTELKHEVAALLKKVRLSFDVTRRHPLQLSGGQRQRVAIARAIASHPRVIICDEPVSALDVSVQAQVLDLLDDLQEELGLTYLFISHDLGVIRHISDDVVVMSQGQIVEQGETEQIFNDPQHAYTKQLLGAVPDLSLTLDENPKPISNLNFSFA